MPNRKMPFAARLELARSPKPRIHTAAYHKWRRNLIILTTQYNQRWDWRWLREGECAKPSLAPNAPRQSRREAALPGIANAEALRPAPAGTQKPLVGNSGVSP